MHTFPEVNNQYIGFPEVNSQCTGFPAVNNQSGFSSSTMSRCSVKTLQKASLYSPSPTFLSPFCPLSTPLPSLPPSLHPSVLLQRIHFLQLEFLKPISSSSSSLEFSTITHVEGKSSTAIELSHLESTLDLSSVSQLCDFQRTQTQSQDTILHHTTLYTTHRAAWGKCQQLPFVPRIKIKLIGKTYKSLYDLDPPPHFARMSHDTLLFCTLVAFSLLSATLVWL